MDNIDAFGVAILLLGIVVVGAIVLAIRESRRMAATTNEVEGKRLWWSTWFILVVILVYLPATAVLFTFWLDQS